MVGILVKRVHWIDYAKFIGIYLVVIGHLELPMEIKKSIYAFHMPLFFFISGYLFSFTKYQSFKGFLTHRFKQIIIPYFIFSIITYLFWLAIGRKFRSDANIPIALYKPIVGTLYGNGNNNYLLHDMVLWFLPCLFVVEVLFYISFKNKTKVVATFILFLYPFFAYISFTFCKIHLPWGADTALTAIVFYGVGNVFKDSIKKAIEQRSTYIIIACVSTGLLFITMSLNNGRVDMLGNVYNNYAFFIVTAFIGIIFCILVSQLLAKLFGKRLFFEYISKNTIIILAFHSLALTAIKAVSFFVFRYPATKLVSNLTLIPIIAATAIFILIPIMDLYNFCLPLIIGKKRP